MRPQSTSVRILAVALALAAALQPSSAAAPTGQEIQNVLTDFIKELTRSFPAHAPGQGAAASAKADDATTRRRLLSGGESLQEFLTGMMGSRWHTFFPNSWSNGSFDWSRLGEFDYGSNLGDFLDSHDRKNLTDISSMKDLHDSYQAIEDTFCTPESFSPSEKVPASCTGPTVSISLSPKWCYLESEAKQVVCSPAKLVLTKTPGVCVHKYHSASVWEGKECKISGGAGFSDLYTVGGASKRIPLAQFDFEYIPS